MATSIGTDLCNICEVRNKTCQAIKWCPECEEKLCEDCYGNHSASKLSRNHEVIDIEQHRKLPECVLAVKNICDEHNLRITNFCQQHDKVVCPVCISKTGAHSKCITVALKEVIKTAKTSVLLQSVEDTLKNLKHNLSTIISDRQSNLQNLHDQKDKVLKEVKQMKEKIIKHLNIFEKNLSDKLHNTIMKHTSSLTSEIASLEEKIQQAETMSNESYTMKNYGSDLQIFIGSRSMDQQVKILNNNVRELVENMKHVGVKIQWDSKVNEVIKIMSSLGSILEEETQMAVVLLSDLSTQVQVVSSPQNMSIDDINITLKSTFQITDSDISVRGCSIFLNNKTMYAESINNNIILINETAEKESIIPISSGPYDVTILNENTVAVSTDEGVEVINITTNTVEKTINIGTCHGLKYYKGSLFCCVPSKGVMSVDLSSSTIATVVHDEIGRGWFYCTVYNDRIFTAKSAYNTVTCYTMTGDKVWEFKDESVINGPHGIDVDNSSNIYISSYENDSIVVLSHDAQRHRTLFTQDGIFAPWALHFDRSINQLLIGNAFGPLLLLSI